MTAETDRTPTTDAEIAAKRLKMRNLALAAVLVGLVVIFYIITLVKGVPLIANRPL